MREKKTMQIRLWGTTQENQAMIDLIKKELKEKVKIISSPYPSKNNSTQRVYLEIDLDNKNYRKHPTQSGDSKTEATQFDESKFFDEIKKRIEQNQ